MKKYVYIVFVLFLLINASISNASDVKKYENLSLGVAFNYPNTLTIDEQHSQNNPLSIVFSYGQPPFNVSIIFKEVSNSNNIEKFIKQEHKNQEAGGYREQIQENSYVLENENHAIEFIRTSEMGKMYYYIFPSQKSNKLLAFWHMTSKIADPEEHVVDAYKLMKESLIINH